MTIPLHVLAGLGLSLLLSVAMRSVARRRGPARPSPGLLAGGSVGALVVFGMVSALFYRGDTFGRVQVLAWTVFLHAPFFLVTSAALLWRRWRRGAGVMAGTAALLGLVAFDAFVVEPRWLQVTTLTLPSSKLTQPVRVVLVADIQTDKPGRYEARVFDQVKAQEPDLILFAGDYVQLGRRSRGYAEETATLRSLLEQAGLSAPLGAYAIAGNVDHPGTWTQVFAGLPVTATEVTTRYDLGPVVLTALGMWDAYSTDLTLPIESKFHIVLGHSPNFSVAPVQADLLLAGHTHGGQVRLPFIGPLLTLTVAPRSWASGVTETGPGETLVVSRGIGMERANAPRMRFLCRPELVVLDLVPE